MEQYDLRMWLLMSRDCHAGVLRYHFTVFVSTYECWLCVVLGASTPALLVSR